MGQAQRPPSDARNIPPQRCCVYCGHWLYAPPRSLIIRCPICHTQIHVKDIVLKGDVEVPRTITAGTILVAQGARVRGDLIACHIRVEGRVLGEVLASQTCHVAGSGKVAGRILCRNLKIDAGAELSGQVERVATA
jgi:cytoskeletal protein CcmA (bactofilin family)